MLSRKVIMILLDVLLFIVFIFLLSPLITGLPLHEWLGIIYFLPVIIHLLFSWKWIKQSTGSFLHKSGWRQRFNYFLNAVLFILVVLEIISGLIISRVVLHSLGILTISDLTWRELHNGVSVGIVLAISFHIALNWQRIASYFKKQTSFNKARKKSPVQPLLKRGLIRISLILLFALLIFAVAYLLIGGPDKTRLNVENEIARFKPKLIPGIVQVTGYVVSVFIIAYIGWKYLKIRL
jgi:Domain of unknown function (DUF4405)